MSHLQMVAGNTVSNDGSQGYAGIDEIIFPALAGHVQPLERILWIAASACRSDSEGNGPLLRGFVATKTLPMSLPPCLQMFAQPLTNGGTLHMYVTSLSLSLLICKMGLQ